MDTHAAGAQPFEPFQGQAVQAQAFRRGKNQRLLQQIHVAAVALGLEPERPGRQEHCTSRTMIRHETSLREWVTVGQRKPATR